MLNMSLTFPLRPSASVYTRETCHGESSAPSARLQGARDRKRDKHTIRDKGIEKVWKREREHGLEKKAPRRESCERDGERKRGAGRLQERERRERSLPCRLIALLL